MADPRAWLRTPSNGRDLTLLAAAVALLFLLTGNHPALLSATRYAEACREMVETGRWGVPQLGYVPYFEKPILAYWLGAACQWLAGGGNYAIALPGGIAALVSVWATYALGVRLVDRGLALLAALALLFGSYFLAMATVFTTDPVLAACLALCWWTWWRWEESGRTTRWIWGFWLALGLGFLTKGPVAVALAGAAIAGYAWLSDGFLGIWRLLWAMHPLRGTLLLLALNLPWSWVIWREDPRFLSFFYIRFNLEALYTNKVNHPEAAWFYLPLLPLYLAPTVLLGLPALVAAAWRILAPALARLRVLGTARPTPVGERGGLYLVAIVVFPLLFLSASASKLPTYPLPLLPALALLVVDQWRRWQDAGARWVRWPLLVQAALLAAACVVAPLLAEVPPQEVDWAYAWILPVVLAALVLGSAAAAWCAWRGRLLASQVALYVTGVVVLTFGFTWLEDLVPNTDARRLAEHIAAHGTTADRVVLQQEAMHHYEFDQVLCRRLQLLDDTRERGMGHFAETVPTPTPFPEDTYTISGANLANPWLTTEAALAAAWNGPQRIWLVCGEETVDRLRAAGVRVQVIDRARLIILVSNRR